MSARVLREPWGGKPAPSMKLPTVSMTVMASALSWSNPPVGGLNRKNLRELWPKKLGRPVRANALEVIASFKDERLVASHGGEVCGEHAAFFLAMHVVPREVALELAARLCLRVGMLHPGNFRAAPLWKLVVCLKGARRALPLLEQILGEVAA